MRVFSLRNKLLFFSVILALIPLGIAGLTLITITQDELKSSVNEELSTVAHDVAEEIDSLYRDTWRAPLLMIRNGVDNENLGAAEKGALFLNGIKNVPDIASLQLTAEGVPTPLLLVTQERFVERLREGGVDPKSVVRITPESISALLDPEDLSIGDLTYIPVTDTWLLTMVVSLERKILDRPATLSARINLDRLRERIALHPFRKTGTITLVDRTGHEIFDPERPDLSELDIIQAAIQLRSSGSRAIGVRPYRRPTNEMVLGAFSFPRYLDWTVVVEENEAHAYLAITKMIHSLIMWVLIGFCVAAVGSIVFAQRISRPIVKIGRVADIVGKGDLTVRVGEIKTRDEISDLGRRMNEMVEGLHERFELQKFVSEQTIDAIKGADERGVKLGGQRKKATVFFSDIRGFTEFSERVEPEVVIEMLNTYLRVQAGIVSQFHGDIDKYVGDQLVAVFQDENMAQNAVLAAFEINAQTATLNETYPEWNINIGIGINTGELIMGAMGSEDRMDFTILGDTVNLGARLCAHATRGQILLSEATQKELKDIGWIQTAKLEPIRVKGKSEPIQVYEVVEVQPKIIERRYSRVEVRWPCALRTVVKSIGAELRDLSAGGALIYCQDQIRSDETFQLVIKAPNGKSLAIATEVVWSDFNERSKSGKFGSRFTEPSEEDRLFLLEVISQLGETTTTGYHET
jgi:adenylate cyclase